MQPCSIVPARRTFHIIRSALDAFDSIVPCGIRDAGVASLTGELGRVVTVGEVIPEVTGAVIDALDGRIPVTECNIERVTFEQAVTAAEGGPARPESGPAFTTRRF